jgi:hypothetical protein
MQLVIVIYTHLNVSYVQDSPSSSRWYTFVTGIDQKMVPAAPVFLA